MNTTDIIEKPPWENFQVGQGVGEDVEIPPGDLTIIILIGEGENHCRRSTTIDCSNPQNLLGFVRALKGQCEEKNCNMCCSRPTKGIGTVIFESWDARNQTLTLRLCYYKK